MIRRPKTREFVSLPPGVGVEELRELRDSVAEFTKSVEGVQRFTGGMADARKACERIVTSKDGKVSADDAVRAASALRIVYACMPGLLQSTQRVFAAMSKVMGGT